MREGAVVEGSERGPVTQTMLVRDLRALGLEAGMTVLVHSSLSALGWVAGGPVAVVLALEEVLGPTGTLVMPSHSNAMSDPARWQNPPVPEWWWQIIYEETPAYDPDLTPTRKMGAIADCFRGQSGVRRSAHPSDSFAAWGHHASQIIEGHGLAFGLGERSPLARLYDLDGWVLLLGVGHGNNTSIHLAEYRANFPGKEIVRQGAPMKVNGVREWVWFQEVDLSDDDFPQLGEAFDALGHTRRGPVGHATALLMPQRPLVDFAVGWLEKNR